MKNQNCFVLKSTTSSNPNIQDMTSLNGFLEQKGDAVEFHAENGMAILFYPKRTLGSITDIRSDQVTFETKNSVYVFERKEKREKLFDYHKGDSNVRA